MDCEPRSGPVVQMKFVLETNRQSIRTERVGDAEAISEVVTRAYAGIGYSDHREHLMVDRLRESGSFVPDLSLVAEIGSEIIGHLLLSRVTITGDPPSTDGLALAPLSVAPKHQAKGVGHALVSEAHLRARRAGFGYIVLVGPSDYYRRFGYEPLSNYPVTLPFDAPAAESMILILAAAALRGVNGEVQYDPAWLNH